MPIFSGSRYEGVDITGIKTLDGNIRKFLHDRRIFSREDIGPDSIEHVVSGDEQLDGLAETFYGDQNLWWLIADVNDIHFALDLAPGQRLLIPSPAVVAELGFLR